MSGGDETLYNLVKEAYENATFNGYNLELMTDEQLALDMLEYDADIENYPYEEVLACIAQFREENE